ncbi:hypothetical protein ACQPW3_21545 [Actinosynnema sp. CA-248983]
MSDADPADVMPPGWTPGDVSALLDFYCGLRADSFEIVQHGDTVGFIRGHLDVVRELTDGVVGQ